MEITDIDQAEKLKGTEILISKKTRGNSDGVYYYRELLGRKVLDDERGRNRQLTDIEAPGANDIWEVTDENGKSFCSHTSRRSLRAWILIKKKSGIN